MINSKNIFLTAAVLFISSINAMNFNYGYIMSYDLNTSGYIFINNGTLKGLNSATINVTTFKGNGTVDSPNIKIFCNEFHFTGKINTNGSCVICVKKPFDTSNFTRSGSGQFTIIESSNTVEEYSKSSLFSHGYNLLISGCLVSEHEMDNNIEKIAFHALTNSIDEKSLLRDLLNSTENQIQYHHARIGQDKDDSEIKSGLIYSGIGATVVGASAAGIINKNLIFNALKKRFSDIDEAVIPVSMIMLGSLSILPIIKSVRHFVDGFNPQHEERYEKLLIIKEKLKKALSMPSASKANVIKLK